MDKHHCPTKLTKLQSYEMRSRKRRRKLTNHSITFKISTPASLPSLVPKMTRQYSLRDERWSTNKSNLHASQESDAIFKCKPRLPKFVKIESRSDDNYIHWEPIRCTTISPPRERPNKPSYISIYFCTLAFLLSIQLSKSSSHLPVRFVEGQRLAKYQRPFSNPVQAMPIPPRPPITPIFRRQSNVPDIVHHQGGVIKEKNTTFRKEFNPVMITKNIVVRKDAKLTIEPGTELLFAPQVGIIVHGTLDILGNANDRVRLRLLKSTQTTKVRTRSHNNNQADSQQVRLVDGDFPSEGRVQILLNDRWHSLCTSSKNLTSVDIKVLCHQMGYQEGYWYRWFDKLNSTTKQSQMMARSFQCTGSEVSINQCSRWDRIRIGGGICDNHSDIGIRCSKKLYLGPDPETSKPEFWKGIEFIQSDTNHEYVLDGLTRQKISNSNLQYVTISEAGLDEVGNATGAIKVIGQPPRMSNIEVKNSVYGIVLEDVDEPLRMDHIRVTNSMGFPLFINTSWGDVTLDNMHVENNGGDGIRVARHERIVMGNHDFCKFANLGLSQAQVGKFPILLSHEQAFFKASPDCCQEFISNNNQLTVHFPVLRSTSNNLLPESDNNRRLSIPKGVNIGREAHLVIYDDYRDEFPFRLQIKNGTRAQSIVSKSGRLKICYEPAEYRTILFTIAVVAGEDDEWSGQVPDLRVFNSYIKSNQGRGIWVDNHRSGIRIYNTTVLNHNLIAGMHFTNGSGEVIIQRSSVVNNTGHGVFFNLAGGYFHIDNSTISHNTQKGIAIEYDKRTELSPFNHTFHLGYTLIEKNGEFGLHIGNICRSDAFWNISMNTFIENGEDAINFESCLPTPEIAPIFRTLTSRLNISDPEKMFHNNYQDLLITHNVFLANMRLAINMAPVFYVKSYIRHNLFREQSLAVIHISNRMVPELGLKSSPPIDQAHVPPTSIRIASNWFVGNRGRYVANIGLQEDNPRHHLTFTKNTLLDNVITEPYVDLKPRSRVSAVLVVSSSNTKVIRNRFNNPESTFEMGSHLEMHSKVINATTNSWGPPGLDAQAIYKRIFDRKNRYNLAQIEFLQYLMSPEDLEYASDLSFERERDKISTFKQGIILGGEVKGLEELPPDTYIVQNDIFVRSGGHLILKPGTVLKFHDGTGMMVQGRLDALGQNSSQIVFTSSVGNNRISARPQNPSSTTAQPARWIANQPTSLSEHPEIEDDSELSSRVNHLKQDLQTRSRRPISKRQAVISATQNIRLSHVTLGRLEVQLDGVWGSVCDYNFDIDDAAVACQQMGMVLNKEDWRLDRFQYASNEVQQVTMLTSNVLMTNLQCDPSLDTDFTKCKADLSSRGDFDGMCNSEVGIRCFPPSWSGVRIGLGAETSTLEHVTIQKAGMYDYATYSLRPALQVDLNRHWLSYLTVRSNSDTGLAIMWNDVIGRHHLELAINEAKFHSNERHGIELRSRGLTLRSCQLVNNRHSGLDYSPTFTQHELSELLSWLRTPKNSENVITISSPIASGLHLRVPSSEDSYRYYWFERDPAPNLSESFTISTDPGHMLSVHLLNPIHPESTESLNMSMGSSSDSPIWDFRYNTSSFPMVSPGYKFHFNYSTGLKPRGNMILYIRSRYNNRDLRILTKHIPAHLVRNKFDQMVLNINKQLINSIVITNSTISKNGIGLKFRHPNYPIGLDAAINCRYANETTNITHNIFDSNHFSPIFVGSEEFEFFGSNNLNASMVPTAEVHYNLVANRLRRNKDGIRQFSRDIRSSNNVFHWSINDTVFEHNKAGGIHLTLPYFWLYDRNLSHTVDINNNTFLKNSQFELVIEGHFASINLTNNIIRENRCRQSILRLAGMEKQFKVSNNLIDYNICNRIVQVEMISHADKLGQLSAYIHRNSLQFNRRLGTNTSYLAVVSNSRNPNLMSKLHPQASDFTLGLSGIQMVNMSRNLFFNPDLRYELVVGLKMRSEDRKVQATENYWGSVLQSDISNRIFDFDDWNCFALAETSPILTQDTFSSATMILPSQGYSSSRGLGTSSGMPTVIANRILGGRLQRSMTLPVLSEPYIVESDLTIMPGVKLIIEKGVTLKFMPNVGILVLGNLIAAGTLDRPIRMKPVLNGPEMTPFQTYLFPPNSRPVLPSYPNPSEPGSYEYNYALKHYRSIYPIDVGFVRLCKSEICSDGTHLYDNNVEEPNQRDQYFRSSNNSLAMDGFLEIYNMTSLQWVPVCDPLFSEHTAQVICRQLGFTHLSVFKRGRRFTIDQEQISSVASWPQTLLCEGDESNLSQCSLLPAGYTNHSTVCHREGNQFVYVHCSDYPELSLSNKGQSQSTGSHAIGSPSVEHANHWGGVRFSCPFSSTGSYQNSDTVGYSLVATSDQQQNPESIESMAHRSRMTHVLIERAGMTHRKRSPAIQVLQCNVQLEHITVENSAHHGIELITSQGNQNFHQLKLRNNLGVGINYVSLAGSSSATRLVPYLPLKRLELSSDIPGLIDICSAEKEVVIGDRTLLFYRYSSQPVDCIKIVSSFQSIKHIGLRMLHFSLFNSTSYLIRPDSVRLYDGNIFDPESKLMVELGVTERHRQEKPELKFYQTSDSTLTIRLHASAASPMNGFVAEVVTTPVNYNLQRDAYNNFTFSEIIGNKLGAFEIHSAGESTPNLLIRRNRFEGNCMHLFGNFTSCIGPINMELQNCQRLKVQHNLIKGNQGGIVIKSYSHSAVSALDAQIENNVFEANQNTNTLALLGPKSDPYQTVKVVGNVFTRNVAPYLSNVVLSRIVANFSNNILSGNVGKHQLELIGFDKLPLSHQTLVGNWIYNNVATLDRDRSTISGNSAGQQYSLNYLVNPDNHFEVSTVNWSRYDVRPLHQIRDDEIIHLASGDGSTKDLFRRVVDSIPIQVVDSKRIDLYQASINARNNWWGFNTSWAIQGRIRDRLQHEELIKVDFAPFLESNRSVLSGVCSGGWQRVGEACLLYIGARMTYKEARDFCDQERGTMPLLRANHYELANFLASIEPQYDPMVDRIWVRSFDISRDACPALSDFRTRNFDCNEQNPFICEKDPQVVVNLWHWYRETGGLVALILAIVTTSLIICCAICWGYKSRYRRREKLERKNNIYASMRSNASRYGPASIIGGPIGGGSSQGSLSELFLHRQLYNSGQNDKSSINSTTDQVSLVSTQLTQPTNDTTKLVQMDPNGYSQARTRTPSLVKSDLGLSKIKTTGSDISARNQRRQPILIPEQVKSKLSMDPSYGQPSIDHNLNSFYNGSASSLSSRASLGNTSIIKAPSTPTPLYPVNSSISQNASTRTPSYSGSAISEHSIPPAVITYSQIQHQYPYSIDPMTGRPWESEIPNQPNLVNEVQDMVNSRQQLRTPMIADDYREYVNFPLFQSQQLQPNLSTPLLHNQHYQPQQLNNLVQNNFANKLPSYDVVDESVSSVPTNYSNQRDTSYEESSQSYLESYQEAYSQILRQLRTPKSDGQTTYDLTQTKSTVSDVFATNTQMRSSSNLGSRQKDMNFIGLTNNTPPTSGSSSSPSNLIGMRAQALSDYAVQARGLTGSETGIQPSRGGRGQYPTSSEIAMSSSANRYLMETSFDTEISPTMAPPISALAAANWSNAGILSGDQVLSQKQFELGSSTASQDNLQSDSKSGSRVYLETSFE